MADLFVDSKPASAACALLADYARAPAQMHSLQAAAASAVANAIKMPALIGEDLKLTEPVAIMVHLAHTSRYGTALVPEAPEPAALVHMWLGRAADAQFAMGAAECETLQAALAGKTFLVGTHITLADIAVFSAVHAFLGQTSDAGLAKYYHVVRWFDHLQSLEGFGCGFAPLTFDLDAIAASI
jgi:glutathione S-transferase